MRRVLIVGAALIAGLSAAAVAQAEPLPCSGDFFSQAQDDLAAYRVSAPKTNFYNDIPSCPGQASCRMKSYVVAKDVVLVSGVDDGWACAMFVGKTSFTHGWLRVSDLAKLPPPAAKPTDWAGTWFVGEETQITISRDGNGLRASGDTTSPRPSHPTGGFDGVLAADGPRARYSDDLCVVRFRRFDRYLIVDDNDRCGGMGVSFDGVYTR
ncbi:MULTISPECIES: hypothetical protein [unclassified Caulobacter]|uniref:hypothetical protein n=1 Tax=unclassified Caulobacter TaxID=2648921 RepID=UPI0006F284A8|nr:MULTISPECIES: hypothetical protein [unclassified Caulobacter]KQV56283.1 hypothetical protein ASC62_20570 [Caulobacter sp. Root342]KQV70541.1 hypothetical protein ASC70_02685 [Caulobacter sp. Root343]